MLHFLSPLLPEQFDMFLMMCIGTPWTPAAEEHTGNADWYIYGTWALTHASVMAVLETIHGSNSGWS